VVLGEDNLKYMIELFVIAFGVCFILGYGAGKSKRNDEIVELEFDKRTLERILDNYKSKTPSK